MPGPQGEAGPQGPPGLSVSGSEISSSGQKHLLQVAKQLINDYNYPAVLLGLTTKGETYGAALMKVQADQVGSGVMVLKADGRTSYLNPARLAFIEINRDIADMELLDLSSTHPHAVLTEGEYHVKKVLEEIISTGNQAGVVITAGGHTITPARTIAGLTDGVVVLKNILSSGRISSTTFVALQFIDSIEIV